MSNCCGLNYDQSISRIFQSNFWWHDENNKLFNEACGVFWNDLLHFGLQNDAKFEGIMYLKIFKFTKKKNLRGTMRTLRFLSLLSARWPAAQSPIVNLGVWWDISWKVEKIRQISRCQILNFLNPSFSKLLLEVSSSQLFAPISTSIVPIYVFDL